MKTILVLGLLLINVAAYSQGRITFNDNTGAFRFHIYAIPSGEAPIYGNGANDIPAGSTVFGNGAVLLGGSSGPAGLVGGAPNYSFGNNFTVQLYAAPGTGDAVSSLMPVSQYVSVMRQTSQPSILGTFIPPRIYNDPGIPNTPFSNPTATVALACWYNGDGTITSLSAAASAGVPWGESLPINLTSLGEDNNGGGIPTVPADLTGMTSFTISGHPGILAVPEPSTIALGVMGACAFLARRRKS